MATRLPIYLQYDKTKLVGFLNLDTDLVPDEIIGECALVPLRVKQPTEEKWNVLSFALVPRVEVDTRPTEFQ